MNSFVDKENNFGLISAT